MHLAPPRAVAISDAYALARYAERHRDYANRPLPCACLRIGKHLASWDGGCKRCRKGCLLP